MPDVTRKMLVDLNKSLGNYSPPPTKAFTKLALSLIASNKPLETSAEIAKLNEALSVISPDTPRGDGKIDLDDDKPENYWLGVIWAIAGLDWSCGKEIAREWSKRSDRYKDKEFEDDWSEPKPDHPNPIGIGSVYMLATKFENETATSTVDEVDETEPGNTSIGLLKRFSATGTSKQMRKRMLEDIFVMKGIAIFGQWTTLYAAPNTGKTLLTLWLLREQIKAGTINGNDVYYVNADDTFRGAVDKTELAEEWDMQMLLPNINEFKTIHIPVLMKKLAEDDQAKGVIFVLDTLKKFTDLMDKTAASEFGTTARNFVSAGGTLICLAHTNKHKDADGKGIYSGTSDIVDDCDCMYVIDKISSDGDEISCLHTVEFNNQKARGDVSSTAAFSYQRSAGQSYSALLNSVKRVDSYDVDTVKKNAVRDTQQKADQNITTTIVSCIGRGILAKSQIIESVATETADGPTKVRKVLERWTGENYEEGHRWSFNVGAHNKSEYSILPPPSKY